MIEQQRVIEVNVPPPTRDQIREQVRDAVRAAEEGVRDAQASGQGGDRVIRIQDGAPPFPRGPGGPGAFSGDPGFDNGMPREIVEISIGFFIMCAVMVIGWPIARAFGKRIERRAEHAVLDPRMTEQLQRIEQAVDSMSVEIERISESQRFMAKLQSQSVADRSVISANQ